MFRERFRDHIKFGEPARNDPAVPELLLGRFSITIRHNVSEGDGRLRSKGK